MALEQYPKRSVRRPPIVAFQECIQQLAIGQVTRGSQRIERAQWAGEVMAWSSATHSENPSWFSGEWIVILIKCLDSGE
jgi:hypothetical protein